MSSVFNLGVKEITHYAAELNAVATVVVPLGKTVKLNRAHVVGISAASQITSGIPGAFLVDAGDGTASNIQFQRYGTTGVQYYRASVVEYY